MALGGSKLEVPAARNAGGMDGRPGFIIRAVTQSAQSPDLNAIIISFFHFPQCDMRIQFMCSRFDITMAVKRSYAEYPAS